MVSDPCRKKVKAIIDALLSLADKQGYVTIDDLMVYFPNEDDDHESIRVVIVYLRNQGVEIIDSPALLDNKGDMSSGRSPVSSPLKALKIQSDCISKKCLRNRYFQCQKNN